MWSFVVLFLSCVVWCCSCRVFVCVTCFFSYNLATVPYTKQAALCYLQTAVRTVAAPPSIVVN